MSNLLDQSIFAMNASSFLYLGACFAFIISISRASSEKITKWARWASYLVWLGFALHTFGLGARWVIGGIGRPPWTNLYESLIAFAWGVVAIQLYAVHKWKLPILGVIASPLVYILMGMGALTPNKLVEPLIPALQSHWIKTHVLFGITSYAGFTIAGCIAFLYLMRRGVSLSKIGAGLSLILVLNLSLAGGNEAFSTGDFYMAKTVERTLSDGRVVYTKDTYQHFEGGPMITRMEKLPYAQIPFWLTWALFLAAAAAFVWTRKKENDAIPDPGESADAESAARKGHDVSKLALRLYAAGLFTFACLFANVTWAKNLSPNLSLASNPYLMVLLVMSFLLAVVYCVIQFRYLPFLKSLPSATQLDEFSYKNILFAFPFQSLLLVTGAVWAYSAWGRSWGWDPKETWALITWFAYLIYLHGRLLFRWNGVVLSIVAIVGFVIVIFAFLGVNLVLSGLHSYGAA